VCGAARNSSGTSKLNGSKLSLAGVGAGAIATLCKEQ
jgi:hypothetical protein